MSRKKGSKNRVKGFKSVEAIQLAVDEMIKRKHFLQTSVSLYLYDKRSREMAID